MLAAVPASAATVGTDVLGRGRHVRSAIEGRTSIATDTRAGRPRLELAYAIETPHGRRVSISGFPQAPHRRLRRRLSAAHP